MLRNQFKFAIRNITKNLGYSLINILGLTIGITTTLFLLIYVFDELSFDQYHENKDNIYRVASHITETDDDFIWNVAQIPFAQQVEQDYPEIEHAIRFQGIGKSLFKYELKEFYDEDALLVDSMVFRVFTYPMISGNPELALLEPNCIVLTESFAKKFFGDEDPMGKMLTNENYTLKVTGVIEDVPDNSHLKFSALISWNTLENRRQSWGNFGIATYIKLKDGTDPVAFDKKLEEMYPKFMASIFEQFGVTIDYILQPITKIHLYPVGEGSTEASGDIKFVKIFFIIAIFLLVIAGINYMNLTTARSAKRSREVGIRKVAGAHRNMLIRQFLAESIMLTLFSFIISIGLCYLFLPNFNTFSGKELDFTFFMKSEILFAMLGIIIILGVLSGIYPSFFLSRFKPIYALKGKQPKGSSHSYLRKALVIVQFAISLFMIIATLVVYEQLDYIKNRDLGFDKEDMVMLRLNTREMRQKTEVLKTELLTVSSVQSVGSTNSQLGNGVGKNLLPVETSDGMVEKGVNLAGVDYDFISTMNIEILEGRTHSRDFGTDTLGLIVNESMAKRFGWDEPLGKKIDFGPDNMAKVIGLMKDYNQTGLYDPIESLCLYLSINNSIIYIKLKSQDKLTAISQIESAWQKVFPEQPFASSYLDDELFEQVEPDEKRGILFTLFSVVVILIAALGVFGLASFTIEQRTKEIAIRKVLGAKMQTIINLVFKDYLALIGISILLAFPIAFYLMQTFLDSYEYRMSLTAGTFILSAVILTGITFSTIIYHTIKVAKSNPIDSIRIE